MTKPASTTFEHLVRENHRVVYQIAFSVLGNAADAEEIAQGAFVRAHVKFVELREPGRPSKGQNWTRSPKALRR